MLKTVLQTNSHFIVCLYSLPILSACIWLLKRAYVPTRAKPRKTQFLIAVPNVFLCEILIVGLTVK